MSTNVNTPLNMNSNKVISLANGSASADALAVGQLSTSSGVAGPPTAGTYVMGATAVDTNNGVWYCYSGGTPGSWTPLFNKLNPDWPPPSGNLGFDYEFNASTSSLPSGWSWFNQSSSTYTEGNGRGLLYNSSSTVGMVGIYQSLPTAPFTVTAKIGTSFYLDSTDYGKGGLFFTDGTKIVAFEQGGHSGASQEINGVSVEYFTNSSTFNTSIKAWVPALTPAYYLKIIYTSNSNVSFYISADGVGYFPFITGVNLGTYISSPTSIGIVMNGGISGSSPAVTCQFFRVR